MSRWMRALAAGAWLASAVAVAETEMRDVSGFDRILFALPGSLMLQQGDDFEVEIDADPEDLERIETRVRGSELAVRWDEGLLGMWGTNAEGRIEVRITLPALEALEVAGSGDADAGSWMSESFAAELSGSGSIRFAELATEELTVEVSGSGNVTVAALDAALVRVEVNGSGDVELAGAADRQEIEVMGSGDVEAASLEGASVSVEIMGSGDVRVWANETLSAEIMGSGDVRYRGSPRVEREEAGSGRVRAL